MGLNKKGISDTGRMILIVLAILILLLFFFGGKVQAADDFIVVRLYDSNRNLIPTGGQFSIVDGVPGVSFIDLTVNVNNIGSPALSCNIITLTPTAFDTAMVKDTRAIIGGGKASWTSSLINVAPFENPTTPTSFSATVRCSYSTGTETITLPDKSGTLVLLIQPELGTADFTVSVDLGGTPSEFCGDTICQATEDATSCPGDCAVSANVNFRATDLSYPSGSAIAFSTTCGNTLTAYGYLDRGHPNEETQCSDHIYLGDVIMEGLPVSTSFNSAGGTGNLQLLTSLLGGNELWVCEMDVDGAGMAIARYSSSDSDRSKVDTSPIAFDPAKEVIC